MIAYHDTEWGVPEKDERRLFEFLVLESAQAGLSWLTVLKKREAYRRAFAGFSAERVARFTEADVRRLLAEPGIVRNRAKIEAAIANARAVLFIREEYGSLGAFLWRFAGGVPRVNRFRRPEEVPAQTPESAALSRELRRRGVRFFGPVIAYAFMQATGMVNDHLTGCFRHAALAAQSPIFAM